MGDVVDIMPMALTFQNLFLIPNLGCVSLGVNANFLFSLYVKSNP